MSFQQFLESHYIADFAWELFKGISPTVIALITIWINTIIGKKKAEREKFSEEIKELQLMVSNIMTYVVETGAFLLETVQNVGCGSNDAFEAYYSKNKQMLQESRKYLTYANIRAEILKKKNVKFDDANTVITNYSHELTNILEWFNKENKKSLRNFESLCDEVQHKLIDATTKVENVLVDYCMRMNSNKK